jgi:hypothetical protein
MTHRNWGLSAREDHAGEHRSSLASSCAGDAHSNLFVDHLPPDRRDLELLQSAPFYSSLTTELAFPRSQLVQAMFDILTVCVWGALGSVISLLAALVVCGPLIALAWILFFS